jgi:hypothetical protein
MDSIKREFAKLVGASIVDIYINDNGERLAIVVGGTDFMVSVMLLEAEGDCCSNSWVEHVGNAEAGHMARYHDWAEVDMSPQAGSGLTGQEASDFSSGELKLYFFKLFTSKGEVLFEMRNSSNGYYGGSLEFRRWVPYLDFDFTGFKLVREG